VAGVTVSAAGQSTVTDAQGRYQLTLPNPGNSAVVLARKDGYLSMSKQTPVHADATTTQDITLYAEDVRTAFEATQGKIAILSGGAVIDIPPNAVKDASGNPYNGPVTLSASYSNPTTPAGVDAFAQPYAGLSGGENVTLQTVGVIEARLLDPSGQPLQLRAPATLTYPGVSAIDKGAASIPLWWYDDARAIWVEEGAANRLADGSYQGQVTHFSMWNLDVPWAVDNNSITYCIQFQNGAAARWGITMTVEGPGLLHRVADGAQVHSAGQFEIRGVPVNTDMVLVIRDAGSGLTTFVPISPVPPGGNVSLPCQTLVGTADYAPVLPEVRPPPPTEAVPEDTPAAVFAGKYYIAGFNGTAVPPSTMIYDYGQIQFFVEQDGSIGNGGFTEGGYVTTGDLTPNAIDDGGGGLIDLTPKWGLTLSGQVAAGGYVTIQATPAPLFPVPSGFSPLPYAAMTFTGRFPLVIPNSGPSGTWTYIDDTRGGTPSTADTTQFSPDISPYPISIF
jgi:hypothetical protein